MQIIRFPIGMKPMPFIHFVQKEKKILSIPSECPKHCGLPRRHSKAPLVDFFNKKTGKTEQRRYGCPHMLSKEGLARKSRIIKYNEYKQMLRAMALEMHFVLPHAGCAIYFFMPMPYDMLKRNTTRLGMHGKPNLNRPDVSNLLKAVEDALDAKDEHIYHYAGLGKFWTNGEGYIEVHTGLPVYEPFREGQWRFEKNLPESSEPVIIPKQPPRRFVGIPTRDEAEQLTRNKGAMKPFEKGIEVPQVGSDYGNLIERMDEAFLRSQFGEPSGPVDVNDKEAMAEVLKAASKRKRKK